MSGFDYGSLSVVDVAASTRSRKCNADRYGGMYEMLKRVEAWLLERGFDIGLPEQLPPYDSRGIWPYGHHSAYYAASFRDRYVAGVRGDCLVVLGSAPCSMRIRTSRPILVVLRPCGKMAGQVVSSDLVGMCESLGITLVIKGVTASLASELTSSSGRIRGYTKGECWHPAARFDDQTFPEVVLHRPAKLTYGSDGTMGFERVSVIKGRAVELYCVYREWLRWFVQRHEKWQSEDLEDFYSCWLRRTESSGFGIGLCYLRNGSPAAFVLGDFVKADQIDLWVALATKQYNTFTRDVLEDAVRECWVRGAHYVNLGGSEEAGLHWFKTTSFKGCELIRMSHLVVNGD